MDVEKKYLLLKRVVDMVLVMYMDGKDLVRLHKTRDRAVHVSNQDLGDSLLILCYFSLK